MAINIKDAYPANADSPSIDYPTGSFRNDSTPESEDGTPLESKWANDFLGARDAILKEAGVEASGLPETSGASDVLDGIKIIMNNKAATQPEVDAGAVDDKFVTPLKLRFGFAFSFTTNGYLALPSWLGGFIIQWGITPQIASASNSVITLPITFPNSNLQQFTTFHDKLSNATAGSAWIGQIRSSSISAITVFNLGPSNGQYSWFCIGR